MKSRKGEAGVGVGDPGLLFQEAPVHTHPFPRAGTDPIGPSDKLVNKAPERRKLRLGKVRQDGVPLQWGVISGIDPEEGSSPRAVNTAHRRRKISPGPCKESQVPLPGRRTHPPPATHTHTHE